jgi:hypothetical protein
MTDAAPTYLFAIQYGLGELRFDLPLADALRFSNQANRMMATADMPFPAFRLQMWDMLANSLEAGDHLKGGVEAHAVATGAVWLALTSEMHRAHPERDGFVLKLGARPGEIGVEIDPGNVYAEPHDERGQVFAVANVTRAQLETDSAMFRQWADGIRAEIDKAGS